jgi:hypothetical protein
MDSSIASVDPAASCQSSLIKQWQVPQAQAPLYLVFAAVEFDQGNSGHEYFSLVSDVVYSRAIWRHNKVIYCQYGVIYCQHASLFACHAGKAQRLAAKAWQWLLIYA